MSSLSHFYRTAAIVCGGILIFGPAMPQAAAQVFTIDPAQSSITVSGTVLGGAITNQGPGSLATKMAGTIRVSESGNTIQFTGQSQILAQTNGSWQPKSDGSAGSEPADFGAQANLGFASGVAALRNVLIDCASPAMSLNAGHFDSTNLTFAFPTNSLSSLAYNVTGLVKKQGALILTGYATNKVTALSSLNTSGGQQVLTIPVDATFFLTLVTTNDTAIKLKGQLVATQSVQAPFQVLSLGVQNQSLVLQWQGASGQAIQVQSSTDLLNWITNTTISGSANWTGAVSGPVGFFRLAK